jgi:hypothetical protein
LCFVLCALCFVRLPMTQVVANGPNANKVQSTKNQVQG